MSRDESAAALTREVRGLYHLYVCPTCLWYNRVLPLLRRVTS